MSGSENAPKKSGAILIIGAGIAGMEAALNCVGAGFKVYLADRKPNIGGNMAQLDKIFPTNDCSMCVMAPKLVEVGKDPNIELLMNSEVFRLEGKPGHFKATLRTRPRRVIPDTCTSCTSCAAACPLEVGNVYNEEMSLCSAAFINFPQAIPSTYMIDRQLSPCVYTCPVNLNARDYIGLIAEGKFFEALDLIRDRLPFPGIIGRICAHPCENACLRGRQVDQPIAICALKRFLADYEVGRREPILPPIQGEKDKKAAVIGAGPAGLACAVELRKAGYRVTVFDANEKPGGMLYAGVPAYRLPRDVLARETSIAGRMGVELRMNTRIGRDIPLTDILGSFDSTFIASGAHGRRKLGLANEDAKGVVSALDFLKDVNTGKEVSTGKRVFVVGGGNVAMDTAITLRRLGAPDVHIVALETWDEMPAHRWEIDQAIEEGIVFHNAWGPLRILARDGRVTGMELARCIKVFNNQGLFDPVYDTSNTVVFDMDMLILVIYETIDTAYLSGAHTLERHIDGRVKVDPVSLETTHAGVFAGGNAVTGPKSAIDAIAQGKRAAESMIRYLEGRDLREGRLAEDDKILDEVPFPVERRVRASIPRTGIADRRGFVETVGSLDEKSAVEEARRCLSCRRCLGCGICEEFCKPEAIDYNEGPAERVLEVGSIIIACGFDEFDSSSMKEFGYHTFDNVLSSVDYERVLSATGPTAAQVMRPSDGRIPRKIAFIQCVGSRNRENPYCSSICCMFAMEEAIISKEHHRDIEPTVFSMDTRTFGKGYDEHYERARTEYGVRYIRSSISKIYENPGTKDLDITYTGPEGAVVTETFDLVVLAVGLRPSKQLGGLTRVMSVELNDYGFVDTRPLSPVQTSRPGVYVCGGSACPRDISETVVEGSAAACISALPLADMRWRDITVPHLPDERYTTGQEPRIGVFICNCGVNIGGIVDVPAVRDYADGLPDVVFAEQFLFTCSQDTQENIRNIIHESKLNRVIVASCSTRTHEPIFQSLIRDAGLNKYLFEMANIRDQCSWVHMHDRDEATLKAKDLVRMAVANAHYIEPLVEKTLPVEKSALVVGGGIAGMTAALSIADQGFSVHLVEKAGRLGGNLHAILRTVEGLDVQEFLEETIRKVTSHGNITVHMDAEVIDSEGFRGNFLTEIMTGGRSSPEEIRHAVTILATGASEMKPAGLYLFGEDDRVMTQLQLEAGLTANTLPEPAVCVMIQCVGSRNEQRQYCSRVCCITALKNAMTMKTRWPASRIVIMFRDMMSYGFSEKHYKAARRMGIRFLRFSADSAPVVARGDNGISVSCFDTALGEIAEFSADRVVLSSAMVPNNTAGLAGIFKLPRTRDGFFHEAHMKLKPVDFATGGFYMAGTCHAPKNISETIVQAQGAAGRALTTLSRDSITVDAMVARVDHEACAACLTCVRTCPFGVPFINDEGSAEIDASKCKGCGTCAAECPAKAIDLMHSRDVQILAKVKAAMRPQDVKRKT
jgi:heterodisulfide reductase subunit A-like polyferredoxin